MYELDAYIVSAKYTRAPAGFIMGNVLQARAAWLILEPQNCCDQIGMGMGLRGVTRCNGRQDKWWKDRNGEFELE